MNPLREKKGKSSKKMLKGKNSKKTVKGKNSKKTLKGKNSKKTIKKGNKERTEASCSGDLEFLAALNEYHQNVKEIFLDYGSELISLAKVDVVEVQTLRTSLEKEKVAKLKSLAREKELKKKLRSSEAKCRALEKRLLKTGEQLTPERKGKRGKGNPK